MVLSVLNSQVGWGGGGGGGGGGSIQIQIFLVFSESNCHIFATIGAMDMVLVLMYS